MDMMNKVTHLDNKRTNGIIVGASIVSVLLSLLMVRRNPVLATFTGLWAPTLLSMGNLMKGTQMLDKQDRQIPAV